MPTLDIAVLVGGVFAFFFVLGFAVVTFFLRR